MAVRKVATRAAPASRERPPVRVVAVDALRGLAIVAMIAYHFSFDLRLFGLVRFDFENGPGWLAARAAIVSSFLALSGVSLALARNAGVPASRRWRRIGEIAACALVVSVASYVAFPQRYIWFGILHAIALASVIAWPFARHPRAALAVGIAIVAAGLAWSHPAFDTRALGWIGFATVKPATEDYVPLFPWLGVMLIGIGIGDALLRRSFAPLAFLSGAPRVLRWLGRHSLAVYMVHQPILIGALALALGRLP